MGIKSRLVLCEPIYRLRDWFLRTNSASLALAPTLIYTLVFLPLNERTAFYAADTTKQFVIAYIFRALAVATFYLVIFGIFFFSKQLIKGSIFYRRWMIYGGIYLFFMISMYYLTFPGHWVHDEFFILDSVKHYSTAYIWQHIFTNAFYALCLYYIPSGAAIVGIQVIILSVIVGYIAARLSYIFTRQWLVSIPFAAFFLPPVILNNLYPLRHTLVAYLTILLVFELVKIKSNIINNMLTSFVWISILVMICALWRPEAFYLLSIMPLIAYKWRAKLFKKEWASILTLSTVILVMMVGLVATLVSSKESYTVASISNPLSTMIQQPLEGENIQQVLDRSNRVINISMLKEMPSYVETPAFWNGALRPTYKENYSQFIRDWFYIVVNNPIPFLSNRLNVFLYSSTFGAHPSAGHGLIEGRNYRSYELVDSFIDNNRWSTPLHPLFKQRLIDKILGFTSEQNFSAFGRIFWSIIPPIAVLTLGAVVYAIQRKWFLLALIAIVLLRVPIIFLTAPANYFFYYFMTYVAGYLFLLVWVAQIIDKRLRHGLSSK